MKVKISIALKSFEASKGAKVACNRTSRPAASGLKSPPSKGCLHASRAELRDNSSLLSIRLPKTQSLYTVLRSPHIDKKSREQFELKIHKQLILISTEMWQLREKLFNLKFHQMSGVQMKVVFNYKTRLTGGPLGRPRLL